MRINIDISDVIFHIPQEKQLSERLVRDVQKKKALDLYRDLIMNTPVDTGALRNAWQIDDTTNLIVISNQLPYAMRVMEDGHSKQAPAGTLTTIINKHAR